MLHERKMEKKNMINLLHKTIKIFKKKTITNYRTCQSHNDLYYDFAYIFLKIYKTVKQHSLII